MAIGKILPQAPEMQLHLLSGCSTAGASQPVKYEQHHGDPSSQACNSSFIRAKKLLILPILTLFYSYFASSASN
jgi:hypothetical protein